MHKKVTDDTFRSESDQVSKLCNVLEDKKFTDIQTEVDIKNLETNKYNTLPDWKVDVACKDQDNNTLLIECKNCGAGIRKAIGQAKTYATLTSNVWVVTTSYYPYTLYALENEPFDVYFMGENEINRIYSGTSGNHQALDSPSVEAKHYMLENEELKNRIDKLKVKLSNKDKEIDKLDEANLRLTGKVCELRPMGWLDEKVKLETKVDKLEEENQRLKDRLDDAMSLKSEIVEDDG
jgi:regulator of replication initiation timing